MQSKRQVVVIHGGDTFKTYEDYLSFLKNFEIDLAPSAPNWKNSLQETLGEGYEVILPRMPNQTNARYDEWVIWFEKYLPFLRDGIILVGNSLGSIFLAKYLSEHDFPVAIKATLLVAAPVEATPEEAVGTFALPASLEKFAWQGGMITLFHSVDDPIVPFAHLEKYRALLPAARAVVLDGRGHFNQPEFSELVDSIRAVA